MKHADERDLPSLSGKSQSDGAGMHRLVEDAEKKYAEYYYSQSPQEQARMPRPYLKLPG
jgi:hypothetical protein